MQDLPRISIITPSFNQGSFIERTIMSILGQDYPDLEYIVVDGGSTDETLDILRKYDDRLTWISEKDEGQSDAINKGIRMATGKIIAYLNTDDMYEENCLSTVADFFVNNPGTYWLTGRCRLIDEHDREVRNLITAYKDFLLRHFSYHLLLIANPISQPATFWTRKIVDDFGSFDRDEHLVMDYEYWLRIGRTYRPAVLDQYLAQFRVHGASKTSLAHRRTLQREIAVAKKYSHSLVINILHRLHAGGVSAAYHLIDLLASRKRK